MKLGFYSSLLTKDRPEHPWWHPLAEPPKTPSGKKPKNRKVPTKIQTLIFSRTSFNKSQARAWAKSHGFKSSKVDETATSYRIRQRDPSAFRPGSMRTIKITTGVKAVVGHLKDG